MKNKFNLLGLTAIITIIVFAISTYLQKQIVDYEPTISCLAFKENVEANSKLSEDMFTSVDMPISFLSTTKVVQNFSEIDALYLKDNVYKSQIAVREQFDTKENLYIYEVEPGNEKVSIKIQSAEYGVSYSLKENSFINVYATLKNEYANTFLIDNERLTIGDEFDGYTIIKILDSVNEKDENNVILNKYNNLIVITNKNDENTIWKLANEYHTKDVISSKCDEDYIAKRISKFILNKSL